MKVRYLFNPADHAKVQNILNREVPGILFVNSHGPMIAIDITNEESRLIHRKMPQIELSHPRAL